MNAAQMIVEDTTTPIDVRTSEYRQPGVECGCARRACPFWSICEGSEPDKPSPVVGPQTHDGMREMALAQMELPQSRQSPVRVDPMMAVVRQLGQSVEALAALGADLRLRRYGFGGDPRVQAHPQDAVRAINPQWLDRMDTKQDAAALAFVQTLFRQAFDLLDNPTRAPGWHYQDPAVLQAQGQLSRLVVRGIDEFASQRPGLSATLQRPGAFLDIGTGVGRLAIEFARKWPALRVVGIDPWEPALALACRNLANSGVAGRIEFRLEHIEQLDEHAAFDLAWLPGPFIAREIVDRALARICRALAPGGWLIFGLSPAATCPLEEALEGLRTARCGGHSWTPEEVESHLRARGFAQIETFLAAVQIRFVAARWDA